jgi:hypothetical protein
LFLTLGIASTWQEAVAQPLARDSNPDTITAVVPAFLSEPPQLGLSVATVLQLQIWKTLRKVPPERRRNSERLSFGKGEALWSNLTPKEPTHEAAADVAGTAQMVVWGKAYPLGIGSSVMAYLTLPTIRDSRLRQFEWWKLTFNISGKDYDVAADIPTRQYAFEPIFLTDNLVQSYSTIDGLPIYRRKNGKREIGTVASASELFALQWEGESVRVRTDKVTGWLRLPYISRTTEVVDFVGGLMRIFRADWDGALELLSRVASNPKTPTELRIDSYLLMARANYQLGHDHQPYLLEAEKFDRFSQRIVRYRVMGMLAGLKTSDLGGLVDKAAATKEYLEAHAHLFSADDGWLPACRQLLAAITKP